MSKNRFVITDRLAIQDSDFVHDAVLSISGDFASMEDKKSYVQMLVTALNSLESPQNAPPSAETLLTK
jgi:hypothetical protein